MMRLLYPLIASALITIVPFLVTFEKGQDIVRGLFGFEYFALLLLIVFVKDKLNTKVMPVYAGMTILYFLFFVVLLIALFSVAWIDLLNLLAIKNWNVGWYGVLPFVTCGLAVVMVWRQRPFSFNAICFILFVLLIFHLAAYNYYAAQPLVQFPMVDYCGRMAPKQVERKDIAEEFKTKYVVTDSVTITRDYVDPTRSNLVILVESWGVPLDINRFESQLKAFEGFVSVAGMHYRMYSRTRTAEREDLMLSYSVDSLRRRDTVFLPKVYGTMGFETHYLFGGDSLEQWRCKYIRKLGFENVFYGNGLDDDDIVSKIDSVLGDTTRLHFVAWTTRKTKFPMAEFPDIYNSDVNSVDSVYSEKLQQTLNQIAGIARKHSNVRIIVLGDHNPILSPIEFQEKFYKRWVPFVVLN